MGVRTVFGRLCMFPNNWLKLESLDEPVGISRIAVPDAWLPGGSLATRQGCYENPQIFLKDSGLSGRGHPLFGNVHSFG